MADDVELSDSDEHEITVIDKQSEVESSRKSYRTASTRARERATATKKMVTSSYAVDKNVTIAPKGRKQAAKKSAASTSEDAKTISSSASNRKTPKASRKVLQKLPTDQPSPLLPSFSQILKMEERAATVEQQKQKETPKRRMSTASRVTKMSESNPKPNFAAAHKTEVSLIDRKVSYIESRLDHLERKLVELQDGIPKQAYLEVSRDLQLMAVPIDAPLSYQLIPMAQLQQYQNEVANWDENMRPVQMFNHNDQSTSADSEHPFIDANLQPGHNPQKEHFTDLNALLSANMRKQQNISKYIDPNDLTLMQQPVADPDETVDLNACQLNDQRNAPGILHVGPRVTTEYVGPPPDEDEMEGNSKIGFWMDRCER